VAPAEFEADPWAQLCQHRRPPARNVKKTAVGGGGCEAAAGSAHLVVFMLRTAKPSSEPMIIIR